MLSMEDWMDIKDLRRQGHSIREIARICGHPRNHVPKWRIREWQVQLRPRLFLQADLTCVAYHADDLQHFALGVIGSEMSSDRVIDIE